MARAREEQKKASSASPPAAEAYTNGTSGGNGPILMDLDFVRHLIDAVDESGIDTLEIESGTAGSDIRVTIGDEIAPGLVARFSRQFGQNEYDEATIEYSLSRILRIRATFSDAATLISRSPLQRYERAGIDLLLFFSF